MIHTTIKEERRKERLALAHADQLHSIGERLDHPEDENITYAAEWDGRSPYLTLHKGAIADLKMAFAGWPMVTKDEYETTAAATV